MTITQSLMPPQGTSTAPQSTDQANPSTNPLPPSPPTSPLSGFFTTRPLPGFEETFDTLEPFILRGDTFGGPSYDVDQESWIRHYAIDDNDVLSTIDRSLLTIMPPGHPKHNDRDFFRNEVNYDTSNTQTLPNDSDCTENRKIEQVLRKNLHKVGTEREKKGP